jgi:[ribosomal protein S5]-alanine N-acetyltransferase
MDETGQAEGVVMIETERLLIRGHLPGDWRDLFEYLSLPATYIFEPGHPITEDEAKKLSSERSQGEAFLPVVLKNENKMIGHLYFNHLVPKEFMTWELGYIFNPACHNHGYATEAARAIITYGFEHLQAHRIVAHSNPKNTASIRVLEKIGMEKEGYFRKKAFFRKDGNGNPLWHDCVSYGILERENNRG